MQKKYLLVLEEVFVVVGVILPSLGIEIPLLRICLHSSDHDEEPQGTYISFVAWD
jgi:hypothetical protein